MKSVRLSYLLFSIFFVGLLSACMAGSPTPQDHYYRLAAVNLTKGDTTTLPYTEIGVPPALADGLYRERAILFVDARAPLELQQYHYHFWHMAPASLVQDQLVDWLQAHVRHTRILRLNPGDRSETMVQTRIVRFERTLSEKGIGVLVELEMSLQQKHRPVYKKLYRQQFRVDGDTMHDTIQAFSDALTKIYRRFLDDLTR